VGDEQDILPECAQRGDVLTEAVLEHAPTLLREVAAGRLLRVRRRDVGGDQIQAAADRVLDDAAVGRERVCAVALGDIGPRLDRERVAAVRRPVRAVVVIAQ
jgi:hypothetical protein